MEGIREDCGIVGIKSFKGENVVPRIYWSLLTLNHRGQQSYGITTYEKGRFKSIKELGLIADIDLTRIRKLCGSLKSNLGIGHTRYATSGSIERGKLLEDAQPVSVSYRDRQLCLAYNGNIANVVPLREEIEEYGIEINGTSDSYILAYELLRGFLEEGDLVDGVKELMKRVDGAYSIVGITDKGDMFVIRDPYGIKPLVYGLKECELFEAASESVALTINGINKIDFVQPGELIIIHSKSIENHKIHHGEEKLCAFEFAYFARPDSKLRNDKYVYEIRRELGRRLAIRYNEIAKRIDVIVPVPQTAEDAAYGFHIETGKPIEPIIVRHRYLRHRAFIMTKRERGLIVSHKYNMLLDRVYDKRIALIDDSIVRGDTLRHIVSILKNAGAREVHVFSTFPKIISPCFYGIDMATFQELIGFNRSEEEIARILGADTVNYQTIKDFCEAVGTKNLCLACVTGKYPTPYAQKIADIGRKKALAGEKVGGRLVEVGG